MGFRRDIEQYLARLVSGDKQGLHKAAYQLSAHFYVSVVLVICGDRFAELVDPDDVPPASASSDTQAIYCQITLIPIPLDQQ